MPAALVAEELGCARGGRVLFDDVSLHVGAGEMLALMGPSGSGKSTMLMLLAGLEPPDRGQVTLDGGPVTPGPAVGLVLQSYGLLSLLTAAENVEVVLQAQQQPPTDVRRRAADVLSRLGLAGHAGHLVDELSGGQQQRVAIARALVTEPRLLLVDEPTAELDPDNQSLVLAAIEEARARGAIVVMATHDAAVAATCTAVVHL